LLTDGKNEHLEKSDAFEVRTATKDHGNAGEVRHRSKALKVADTI
jgi:hypothetical protein